MKRLSDRQAALDEIKAFVRAKAAPDTIDFAALSLSGLSDDALDAGIAEIAPDHGRASCSAWPREPRPTWARLRLWRGDQRACRRPRGYGAR